MTNLEHSFRTLGKFLAIASTVKVYQEVYGSNIPQSNIISLLNDLKVISDDYLYPKYILENNSLIEDFPNSDDDNYWEYEAPLDMDVADNCNDFGC